MKPLIPKCPEKLPEKKTVPIDSNKPVTKHRVLSQPLTKNPGSGIDDPECEKLITLPISIERST